MNYCYCTDYEKEIMESSGYFFSDCIKVDLNSILECAKVGDNIIICSLASFGNFAYKIIQGLLHLLNKGITIHILDIDLKIRRSSYDLIKVLEQLSKIENNRQLRQIKLAEKTRKKNKKKLGRKPNKKTKSMFDKYKRKILKLYKQGIATTIILKTIQQNDDESIKNTSSQALGQYIKKTLSKNTEKTEKKIKKIFQELNNRTKETSAALASYTKQKIINEIDNSTVQTTRKEEISCPKES